MQNLEVQFMALYESIELTKASSHFKFHSEDGATTLLLKPLATVEQSLDTTLLSFR